MSVFLHSFTYSSRLVTKRAVESSMAPIDVLENAECRTKTSTLRYALMAVIEEHDAENLYEE